MLFAFEKGTEHYHDDEKINMWSNLFYKEYCEH